MSLSLLEQPLVGFENTSQRTSRREVNKSILAAGIALAVGLSGTAGRSSGVAAQESSHYRAASAVNLRTGPGTRRRIIVVIPANALLTSVGESKYGYRKVSYQGTVGWAHADYLTASNGGTTDTPVSVGFATTTASVNYRSEPSTSSNVIRILPAGTSVDVFEYFSNGFRMVGYANQQGWVYMDYLEATGTPSGYLTTDSAVNLRTEPNTGAKIILVIPGGKAVRYGDELANGFRRVNYQGTNGSAYDAYLS